MREKGQTEVAKTLEIPVFSRGIEILTEEFEIIEFLLENGADPDFMENPEVVPPHSVCMPVLHDAIIGAFSALCYKQYMQSEKYVNLIKILLEYGTNPMRKTSSEIHKIR